jgi:hypothetical protein
MKTKTQKPSFKETIGITTIDLDNGLQFNAQRIGPTNFKGLREADYGKGFKMATMPELTSLIYASLENKDYSTAKQIIKTLKENWIRGNTGILYTPEGMYVQDNPKLKDGRVSMDEKTLKNRLSKDENGISYSKDKNIRFTPYGFKTEKQTSLELSNNKGLITLVNGEENAQNLAKSSEHYKIKPYFWALTKVESPQTRVAGLDSCSFDGRLGVSASGYGGFGGGCSFGVSRNARSAASKK